MSQEDLKEDSKQGLNDGLDRKTLFVRAIPPVASNDDLMNFFSKFAPVKHAVIVTDEEQKSRGFGFVSFSMEDDTLTALVKSREEKFMDKLLRVDIARRRERKDAKVKVTKPAAAIEKRRARLIVRNLPWSCKDAGELKKIFSKYGAVYEAYIPRKKGGQMCGFAFVIMKKKSAAEKAVKESSGLKIQGREVAVDLAVEKSKWEGIQKDMPSSDEDESEENDAEDIEPEIKEDDTTGVDKGSKADEDELHDIDIDESLDKNSDDGSKDDEDISESEMQEDEDEDEEPEIIHKKKKNKQELFSIFIRNVPYEVTSEDLKLHFEKHFGPVKYALPVMDKETGLSKGSAFLAFRHENAYSKCLESAPKINPSSLLLPDDCPPEYVFEGRILWISSSVDRTSAHILQEKNKAKRQETLGKLPDLKDKRNLFLLNEGRITSNSKLAQYISTADLEIRDKSYKMRVEQLKKNPTLHLSLTRLAIRNIPRAMNAKALKALGRKAIVEFAKEVKANQRQPLSKEEQNRSRSKQDDEAEELLKKKKTKKSGVVRQAKVINEIKTSKEIGRSRGYGFLEYRDHKHALMALRWLNAHLVTSEEIFEGSTEEEKKQAQSQGVSQRRLVVEFAIENAKVVKRRKENIIHSRVNADGSKKRTKPEDDDKKDRKPNKKRKSGDVIESSSYKKKSEHSEDIKRLIGKKRKVKKRSKT